MLGFGVGISHCGIRGGVSDAPDFSGSAAKALLAGESQGLAFDFTDSSAYIIDTGTPANNYDSTGIVSSGSLVGPLGKLTYTSPSNKLTMQADGVMRYQAHNLYLNSAAPANQSITVVSGASYAVTITGTVSVTASGAATGTWTAGTNTFTAATTTLTLGSTSGSGTVHIRRTPSNDDYIETAGAAKYALPLEYSATDGSCLGMLVEEQRTNLALRSTSLDTSGTWAQQDSVVVTANQSIGPTGLMDLDEVGVAGAGAGFPRIVQTVSTSGTCTFSAYVKNNNATTLELYVTGTGLGGGADIVSDYTFTFSTATLSKRSGATADSTFVEDLTSIVPGLYRIGITLQSTTITDIRFYPSWNSTTTKSCYIGYVQLEQGSFPTSPILTYGAASTRNADPLSQLSTTFPLSATAGSLYAYVAPYAGADLAGIVSLNDGSGDEEIVIYKDASSNIVAQVEDGGVNQLAPLDSTVNASSGTAFKVALAWAANDFALSVDGTAAQTDTGGTLPTVTTLEIGVDQANNYFNGHIKAISYVPRRKSNAELQAETT